jgi:hypothetical protein
MPGWLPDDLIRPLYQDTRPLETAGFGKCEGPWAAQWLRLPCKTIEEAVVRNGVAAQDSPGGLRFLLARRPFHETLQRFGASEMWASAPHRSFLIDFVLDPPGQRVLLFALWPLRLVECVLVCHSS